MADDYTENSSTSGTLAPGGQTRGVIEAAYDNDWFRIALTAGRFYTFELAAPGLQGYQWLSFHDSQGGYIATSNSGSNGVVKYTVKALDTGNFYIAVHDQSYTSGFTALSYTLKASAAVIDDIGDTRATAKQLVLGQKTSAVLEASSDIDYFKFSAQAGITYTITPTWNPGGGTSLAGNIRVEDTDGTYISMYPTSAASFTATRTGDYYFSSSNWYGPVTNYDVTVSKTVDDHAANTAGAGQLTIGAAATSGNLEVQGDRDWYGVQLNAGTTYWLTMGSGAASPAYYGSGAVLKLLTADGTVVATSSGYTYIDSATSMLLQYVPTAAGKYYLEISDTYSGTGKYQVRAVVGEKDDYGNTQATAAAISAGNAVQGKLAIPQDSDVFKLSMIAGKTYLVALAEQGPATGVVLSLNGQEAIYSGTTTLASYGKAGLAAYQVLTAGSTGDYYFTVNNYYSRGTASYTLLVTDAQVDDYTADKSTKGVLTVGSKATGVLDYLGDTDMFKVTLQYGAKYAFQLRGAGSGEGSLALDNAQLQITSPDQYGSGYLTDRRDGTYTFTSTTGGDYYISVGPKISYGSTAADISGSYALHAVALSGDTAGPALVSHTPASNVAPLDNLTLRFDEAIMRNSSSDELITLRDSVGVRLETYYRDDSRVTISGDTLTINPTMQLKPGSQYLLSVPAGGVTDLAGNKMAGNVLLSIETLHTVATGGNGNDYLRGLGIGDKLSGGNGVDTVIYGYDRNYYDVSRTSTGATVSEKYNSS
ncbi:MAG TPA: Ig-like domain-containing protein, partial [Pseudoduganella sp.]